MNQSSDTPRDGDFARYVEELTLRNLQKTPSELRDMRDPAQATAPQPLQSAGDQAASAGPQPAAQTLKAAFSGIPVVKHLRWLVVVAIALQLLPRIFPELPSVSGLLLPLLLAYGIWLFSKINRNLGGTLARRLGALAEASRPKPPGSR